MNLIKEASFNGVLNPTDLSPWLSWKSANVNFLGNHNSPQYEKAFHELIENFD